MNKLKIKIGILMTCFCALCYLAFAPIIASIAAAFPDVDLSLVQMVITLPNFLFFIFSPLGGTLALKINKKKIVLVSVAMYFFGGIFPFFFHSSIWEILFGCAIIGCGSGMMMPMINAFICQYFALEERGSLMGLNSTFVAIGGLSFTFISGFLAGGGWEKSFLVFLALIPVFIILLICLPEGEPVKGETSKKSSGFEMNPYVAFLFIIGFIYFVVQNAFNTNSSIFVAEMSIGGPEIASTVTMANTLGGIVGGIIFGLLAKKFIDQTETVAMGMATAGFLFAWILPSLIPTLVSSALVGIGFAIFNAAGTLLLSKYLRPETNALTVSVYMAVINVGAALSPICINAFNGMTGGTAIGKFFFCGVILAVCSVVSLVINLAHTKKA